MTGQCTPAELTADKKPLPKSANVVSAIGSGPLLYSSNDRLPSPSHAFQVSRDRSSSFWPEYSRIGNGRTTILSGIGLNWLLCRCQSGLPICLYTGSLHYAPASSRDW